MKFNICLRIHRVNLYLKINFDLLKPLYCCNVVSVYELPPEVHYLPCLHIQALVVIDDSFIILAAETQDSSFTELALTPSVKILELLNVFDSSEVEHFLHMTTPNRQGPSIFPRHSPAK